MRLLWTENDGWDAGLNATSWRFFGPFCRVEELIESRVYPARWGALGWYHTEVNWVVFGTRAALRGFDEGICKKS